MRHPVRLLGIALAVSLTTTMAAAESVARFPDAAPVPSAQPATTAPAPPVASPAPSEPLAAIPAEVQSPSLPTPISGAEELANRGRTFEAAGRFTEAIRAYSDSIRLEPGSAATLLALGRLRARLGDYGEAELLFSTAARKREFAADALTERAHVRKAERRDDDALRDLERAAELAPNDDARTTELASFYVARRAWLPALELYRRVAAEIPSSDAVTRARLQVRALGVLAGELDPVAAGSARDYGFTRRALARLSKQ